MVVENYSALGEFFDQLHFALDKLIYQIIDVLAVFFRQAFDLLLKFHIEVDWQTQPGCLAIELPSDTFGKVVFNLFAHYLEKDSAFSIAKLGLLVFGNPNEKTQCLVY